MKFKLGKNLIITIAIGALLYIIFAIWADYKSLLAALREINLLFIPLVLFLVFINYFIRFLKWDYYLRLLKIKISKKDSFNIFFSGLSMSITPGKMGELLKCYLLKKINNTPMSFSSSIILAERITDFISLIIIAVIGAYVINYGRELVVIFGILFLLLILIISSRKISLYLITLLEKIRFINKYISKIHLAYESMYSLVKVKPLLFTTIISFAGWFCECLAFYMIFQSFGIDFNISLLLASFIYAFCTLVGALLFLPGGLGVTDGSLAGLLIILGNVSKSYAIAITLFIRAATLWFAVILGVVILLNYQRKLHMNINEIENIKMENENSK
jgi:glycosyltransferase 2 family protein